MVTYDHIRMECPMPTISLKDAKAGFSSLVDAAIKGEFVTITRHGKPVAALDGWKPMRYRPDTIRAWRTPSSPASREPVTCTS